MIISTRLEDIKILINEANEISERITNSNQVSCSDEDRISDILSELFCECHIDWLIEKVEKYEQEIIDKNTLGEIGRRFKYENSL